MFQDVAALGKRLEALQAACQTRVQADVAILFDQETRWALDFKGGPRNAGMHYLETIYAHHMGFWKQGIMVDVIDPSADLSGYQMVVAPMLYLMPEERAKRLDAYVHAGGILIGTYWGGVTDENDLCHLGDTPYGLTSTYGLWREEIDALWDGEENAMHWNGKEYRITELCERIHPQGASVLAAYEHDFYKSEPVLCKNQYGKGFAYYLAAKAEDVFYIDFYAHLAKQHGISPSINGQWQGGVTVSKRCGQPDIYFVQNFENQLSSIIMGQPYTNVETGERLMGEVALGPYEVLLLAE